MNDSGYRDIPPDQRLREKLRRLYNRREPIIEELNLKLQELRSLKNESNLLRVRLLMRAVPVHGGDADVMNDSGYVQQSDRERLSEVYLRIANIKLYIAELRRQMDEIQTSVKNLERGIISKRMRRHNN